jgi:glycosyltransferase involved in cell wall biosynthesis
MRILMLSDTYIPRISGVATSIRSVRSGLQGLGHTVDLLVPDYGSSVPSDDSGIMRVPAWKTGFYPEERLMRPWALLRMTRELASRGYDLLHVQTPFAAHYMGTHLARRLEIPVLSSYHTYFEAYIGHYYAGIPKILRLALARIPSRQQCQAVDGVIVPSMAMATVLWGYGVNTPIRVIPTGIDLTAQTTGDRSAFRDRHGIAADRLVLLYAGRIAPEKNIALLVEVVGHLRAIFPGILLLLAGDGPFRESLEQQVVEKDLTEQVRFLGYLDHDTALRDAYAAADLLVFASETETQGMVLLEALAAGLPLVAIAAMGAADFVTSGRGTRAAPAQASGFAEVCAGILSNDVLRARMAQEARELATQWAEPAMAERLQAFYAVAVAGGKSASNPAGTSSVPHRTSSR